MPGMASGKVVTKGTMEKGVEEYYGMGESEGLPTMGDDRMITLNYHQVSKSSSSCLSHID